MNTGISLRASHVNTGTSVPREELARPDRQGPVARHPRLQVTAEAGAVTAYGGLALATALVRRLDLARRIDVRLRLLKQHRPFHESDHVLSQAYNLYVGGTCIEDMAELQGNEAVLRMVGACRLPDPTTAGDFLRRFGEEDLRDLNSILDEAQEQVWRLRYGKKKQPLARVDIDSHVKEVYGSQKEGADFSYKGTFAYHPLVISLASTQECLRLINRPGNQASNEGAAQHLRDVFPMLVRRFERVVVRGDSAFFDHEILKVCEEFGQSFAIVVANYPNLVTLADRLPQNAWRPFRTRAERARDAHPVPKGNRRKRRQNLRRDQALKRRKHDLLLKEQWVAEVPYRPARCKSTYRLVIRRQRIEEHDRQGQLFDLFRYRFALSNLKDGTAEDILDLTYGRCDQENVLEQLKNGIAAMRMPTGNFLANAAWLVIARLAHNLKSWIAQLALPAETVRWEWKRFRQAFVTIGATVIRHARQTWVRLTPSHRHHDQILKAYGRLQP